MMPNGRVTFGNREHGMSSRMRHSVTLLLVAVLLLGFNIPVRAEAPPCTGAQLATAQRALLAAEQLIDKAIAAIDKPSAADTDRLTIWFGTKSSTDAQGRPTDACEGACLHWRCLV